MAQGKVIGMNEAEKTITLDKGGKIEVGKRIFTQKLFEVGDEISYEMKGKTLLLQEKLVLLKKKVIEQLIIED